MVAKSGGKGPNCIKLLTKLFFEITTTYLRWYREREMRMKNANKAFVRYRKDLIAQERIY